MVAVALRLTIDSGRTTGSLVFSQHTPAAAARQNKPLGIRTPEPSPVVSSHQVAHAHPQRLYMSAHELRVCMSICQPSPCCRALPGWHVTVQVLQVLLQHEFFYDVIPVMT